MTCRCCFAPNSTPASPSITGLFYATAFGLKLNGEVRTGLTFVLGLTLRLLAIRYKWEMPKFVFNERAAVNSHFRRAFATCSGVTAGAALPQALRI